MVIALIAVHGRPVWLDVLIYVTVVVTVLSGADYFFGLRRGLLERERQRARRLRRARSGDLIEPGAAARVGRRGLAGGELVPDLAERAEPLGDDVVLVDRLEVDLAGGDERAVVEIGEALDDAARSSRARSPRRTAGAGAPSRPRAPRRSASSARRSPRTSTARRSRAARRRRSRRRTARCSRCAACRGRAGCAWRPGPPRGSARSASLVEALLLEALARAAGDQLLRARARGHALRGDADQPAGADLGGERRAVQRVQLLRLDPGDGGRLVLGEAGLDGHLGAARALALADELRDVLGERLGLERRLVRGRPAPIASLTTSSKRDMCAPFWFGPRSTTHSKRARNSCSLPSWSRRITFSTPVTPTRERLTCDGGPLGLDVDQCQRVGALCGHRWLKG